MRISIVMPYYNRREQLFCTLRTINLFNENNNDFEIIIIDDASNENNKINDVYDIFQNLNIKIIEIQKEDKKWVNPCIPFNIGFNYSSGDVILIQNPECLHLFDIVKYVKDNICKNKYIVFGCYAIGESKTNKIIKLDFNDNYINNIKNIIGNINDVRYDLDASVSDIKERCGWYQHTRYRPDNLHFCSVIMKSDLDDLGGFDERFAYGCGKDDREFLIRVKRKKMEVISIDNIFVIHQFHNYYRYICNKSNKQIFKDMKKESSFKSKINYHYYGGKNENS